MQYISYYQSPLGKLLLAADQTGITGAWFEDQKYYAHGLDAEHTEKEAPVLDDTKRWLDLYFSGKEPDFMPPLHPSGTPFQMDVWDILRQIPYGTTITYGAVAKEIARRRGITRMSAQAAGGAVGRNPVSILIPCHRVVGANGSLTGYAGGIDRKLKLLALEKAPIESYFIPGKGTAL